MHFVENFFSLAFDHNADLFSDLFHLICHITKGVGGICSVYNHHHIKITGYDRLGNIQNVDLLFCQICTYPCNNTYRIFSNYSNNRFFSCFLLLFCFCNKLIYIILNFPICSCKSFLTNASSKLQKSCRFTSACYRNIKITCLIGGLPHRNLQPYCLMRKLRQIVSLLRCPSRTYFRSSCRSSHKSFPAVSLDK